MRYLLTLVYFLISTFSYAQIDYENLAQEFLYAVRVDNDYSQIEEQLAEVHLDALVLSLDSESRKKAFWLNVYNGYIQLKAKENPSLIEAHRGKFFTEEWITIAGKSISFDDIEHGMLRHSQWKYGMGYIPSLFVGSFEKKLRVEKVDYRVHFALNCGAKGCPPIAFYSADQLDKQLNVATASFLTNYSNYDKKNNEVEVSKILSWFKGDFGGKQGILSLLESYKLIPVNSQAKLIFSDYDWTVSLRNYKE